jgi:hypothetical protein
MRRIVLIVAFGLLLLIGALVSPASATVHELTGMECSGGHAIENPPGLTGGSNADNFAQPLGATGVIESAEFDPTLGGVLITFDFDHPASKIAPHPTEDFFEVEPGTFVTAFVFEGNFQHCKNAG